MIQLILGLSFLSGMGFGLGLLAFLFGKNKLYVVLYFLSTSVCMLVIYLILKTNPYLLGL